MNIGGNGKRKDAGERILEFLKGAFRHDVWLHEHAKIFAAVDEHLVKAKKSGMKILRHRNRNRNR